ncbi:GYDIA family GHMP kinase [Formosa maritima]|uniref:GHMP kinase n=1 Tax=Formosa maritima TaxID=2592046 RepID=A0A5D0G2S8_9FLAO|nr:GYDIA family GHMP kinase [Formosa maritima]TYA53135.1 GHMP kinase [Formosa maritima]
MKEFYSNGKLLITGEYVVLDGALSLAIPTKFRQSLEINVLDEPIIIWKSLDYQDNIWFEDVFTCQEIATGFSNIRNDKSKRLLDILQVAKILNPDFLKNGCHVETKLTFPQNWGLGSSSTLINNIANWAKVDPYKLLELTFGGSGYDIACAQHDFPIGYQLLSDKRHVKEVSFNPSFKDALYFVYLNKKQNSRDGIAQYKANRSNKKQTIKEISDITSKLIICSNISEFESLINKHETIIANIINETPIKEKLFPDFKGSIKSLGAWGGDFVLVTSEENPKEYFSSKGYDTIVPYSEMIK